LDQSIQRWISVLEVEEVIATGGVIKSCPQAGGAVAQSRRDWRAGGMREVYRAKDSKLGRQVAIRILPAHPAANASARERLRAAASLDHPYICKIFGIGEQGEVLFLVMEFIAGETLHQRLVSGRLPLAEAWIASPAISGYLRSIARYWLLTPRRSLRARAPAGLLRH
jgi:hypothetical protein